MKLRTYDNMVNLNTTYLQYFNLNRILLLALGLWPFGRSKIVQFQLILFFSILISFILFQFTTFLTFECTADFVITTLSSSFFFIVLAVKYNSFCVNTNTIRHSMKQLQRICDELQNENEIAIIRKYGEKAKFYTTVITLFAMCSILSAIFLQMWPHIRHITLVINKSQLQSPVYITTEYFIDREKYSYLIMLHTSAALWIGIFAMSSTGTMLITYLQHVCGIFSIASFRLDQAVTPNILSDINYKSQIMICKKIVNAIDIHRKAMECARYLISNFQGSYFFLILCGMVCLTSSLIRIVTHLDDTEQIIISFIFISVCYVYLFLSNHTGQEIIDHNNRVYHTAYNIQWYTAPLRAQKIILILLQRRSKAFNLNLGGLFVVSMESAASLVNASISYFTVLYSMRQD